MTIVNEPLFEPLSDTKHVSMPAQDLDYKQESRDMSVGPPPPPPPHRVTVEKKPPRLSLGFNRNTSTSTPDSPSDSASPSPLTTPVSPAGRMKHRLSSLLTGSTERRPLRSASLFSSVGRRKQSDSSPTKEPTEDNHDKDENDTPATAVQAPHAESATIVQAQSLARLVHAQLGSVVEDVDLEIEEEWEDSRKAMRQSIMMPHRSGLY